MPFIVALLFATPVIAQDLPSYIPQDGLMAWWPFNGNANDESGNGNHGSNMGAVLTTDRFGASDSAYLFDGTSSFINVPSSASLESPTTQLTVLAWVNFSGMSLVGTSPFNPIFTKSDEGANAFMYRFSIADNAVGFFAGTNNWFSNAGTTQSLLTNQWYMLSVVFDGDSAYAYLNDSLVSTQAYITNITADTRPLQIGRDTPGVNEIFNGKIDDLAIWNRALTHEEITALFLNCTATSSVEVQNACNSYEWIDGNTYTESTQSATYTMQNAAGCDSVITLHLTVNNIDASVSINGNTLLAAQTEASYQWYNCDTQQPIEGATGQSFSANVSGNYSVEINNGGCSIVSECYSITVISIDEERDDLFLNVYPIPANDFITISNIKSGTTLRIHDMTGKSIYDSVNFKASMVSVNTGDFANGVYLITLDHQGEITHKKFIINR